MPKSRAKFLFLISIWNILRLILWLVLLPFLLCDVAFDWLEDKLYDLRSYIYRNYKP